ncbi:MAG: putative nucleotidyltransferase [Acidobacteria bacterium]|nr:putative nucleotidyltransferase [Acidobacteriota bacterium]
MTDEQSHRDVSERERKNDRGGGDDEKDNGGHLTVCLSNLHAVSPMDYIRMPAIAPRLRAPIAAALRGERAVLSDLTDAELAAFEQHGIAPLLFAASSAPQLRGAAMRASVLEPLRLVELRRVLDGLRMQPLILKGTALAYSLYDRPELRPRADCDLLIAESDRAVVAESLAARGYEQAIDSGDELALRQASFSRVDPFGVTHVLDVHWAITNTPVFANALTYDELAQRAVSLPHIAANARGLCDVDALLLACIHRVAHHHESERLIWLVDVDRLRQRMTSDQHREFWQRAAERRIAATCETMIALAGQWLERTPHDRAGDWLPADALRDERHFPDRHQRRAAVLAANVAALPTWRQRAQRVRQLAFPPRAFMFESFSTRSRAALPWLYVWRALRGLARLFRRVGE